MIWLVFWSCTNWNGSDTEFDLTHKTQLEPDPDSYIDLRQDYPDPPDGGLQILSPVFEVPPYSEVIYCYFGTYSGPDTGVNFYQVLEPSRFSHHNQLKTTPISQPDGTLEDCFYLNAVMSDFVPIFEAVGIDAQADATGNWLNFPEGVAMSLPSQTQYILDMHFINTTDKTLIVQSGANLGFVPLDEIDHLAGAAQFDSGPLTIPPGDFTDSFDCEWKQESTILSISSHMHGLGKTFYIDHIKADGTSNRIYGIDDWDGGVDPYFPEIHSYEPEEFIVEEGDIFRTTCSWNNPTDQDLEFPAEMCTTAVVLYPLTKPISCIDGVYLED